jgi:predicted esterase
LHPTKIRKIAALAGFIPETWKNQMADVSLKNQIFFISHGKQDEIVPIRKAREAAQLIQMHGAHVTFCEADTGHKLSANCFNGLGDFFST